MMVGAARVLALPVVLLVSSLLAALGVTGWLVAREWIRGYDPLLGGTICAWMLAGLAVGLGLAVALRRLLRPAYVALRLSEVPVSWRFGLLPRLVATLVLLTAIGLFGVAWIESRFSSLEPAVSRVAGPGGWAWAPLWLIFAGLAGAAVGLGVRNRARMLTRRIDDMLRGDREDIEPLPVLSATETGLIAEAFNRLLAGIDAEQASLRDYSDRVERADRLQAKFLRNVSHELRTPLNSIIGFSDLLLRANAEPLSEPDREAVEVINRAGERLLGLINDILLMAQFEADRAVAVLAPERVDDLIREALARWARERGFAPRVELGAEIGDCVMDVDRALLERALWALLEWLPEDRTGPEAALLARCSHDAGLCLQVPVVESACQPDQAEALFQGFSTALSAPGGRAGVRLGLALGRKIARLHGGDLRMVDREPGCWLELRIPVAR